MQRRVNSISCSISQCRNKSRTKFNCIGYSTSSVFNSNYLLAREAGAKLVLFCSQNKVNLKGNSRHRFQVLVNNKAYIIRVQYQFLYAPVFLCRRLKYFSFNLQAIKRMHVPSITIHQQGYRVNLAQALLKLLYKLLYVQRI